MTALISIDGITRSYCRDGGSPLRSAPVVSALRGITFDVPRGERFGLVGESGSGKSTLLRIIAALDRPTSGVVRIDGQPISALPECRLGFLRRRLQLIFQDPAGSLDPRMRVADIITEPMLRASAAERAARVGELLDQVGLPAAAARRHPHEFSGGQRQRISIARALAPRPDILLADEPVSALDVSVRGQILDLVSDLVDELGLTLIFVSHDLSVVRHVCDRMGVLRAGELVEIGPVEEIWSAPRASYTRQLIKAVPTLERALAGAGAADLLEDGENRGNSPKVSKGNT